jgi:hypothetical protein
MINACNVKVRGLIQYGGASENVMMTGESGVPNLIWVSQLKSNHEFDGKGQPKTDYRQYLGSGNTEEGETFVL